MTERIILLLRWRFPRIGSCLILTAALLSSQQTPVAEEVTVDARAATSPFPHYWEQVFGSGRAILSLRDSYRSDLHAMKATTDIHYVRFHAIFDDEVGVYAEDAQGRPIYNWSYVDQIYDGLLENGVRPFVEMSFMPRALAASTTPQAFWYHPLPSPPKDYARWGQLVYNFAKHLVDRYGANEVAQWYFEVWNEPNIDFWTGKPAQATYFELYDQAAEAIKRADSRLRVGGPATAQAAWIPDMIAHAVKARVPLDFVSTHVYGNDLSKDVFGTDEKIDRSEMVSRAVHKVHNQVKSSARPDIPIHWSEYNASYKNEIDVTDAAFMGPWLANNIRLCAGLATTMSYWTFSDVFEEQGVIKTPFYGGYGLIAEGGVPKAAFEAFAMLHRLGDHRFNNKSSEADLANTLVTKRDDGTVVIAVWNYAAPGTTAGARSVHIQVNGFTGTPRYHIEVLDQDHGSALGAWQAMGSPASPTREQYTELRRAAAATRKLDGTSSFMLPAPGLALVEVRSR
ncbi:MAG: glycosyl hydrolase family 39 [Bryobacterales bacterium]|nr:glycosyl hydrolase family 39 [Bryobacterales bacterium]